MHGSKLAVNGEEYSCLIIPYSQYITSATARFIAEANKSSFTTIFIDKLPQGICDEKDSEIAKALVENIQGCKSVSLEELASFLKNKGINEIRLSKEQPYLRYYHYHKDDADFYMFFNEHPYNELSTEVDIPLIGRVSLYDAFSNTLMPASIKQYENSTKLSLKLSAYESTVVVFGDIANECIDMVNKNIKFLESRKDKLIEINSAWKLSLASAVEYPEFTYELELDKLINIPSPTVFPKIFRDNVL